MTPRSLQVVLRSLADAEPTASDSELLRRFLEGDDAPFTELVRRYGGSVGTCRQLTSSDTEADDAFQATFLVFIRNIRKSAMPVSFRRGYTGSRTECAHGRGR